MSGGYEYGGGKRFHDMMLIEIVFISIWKFG